MKRFKKIYLEITNGCNLNCDFCIKNSRKTEYISIDNFKGSDIIIYLMELYFNKFGIILGLFFIICFAFSSILGEFYLGENNCIFIFKNKFTKFLYRLLFSFAIIFGVFYSTEQVLKLVDFGIIILGLINIFVISL